MVELHGIFCLEGDWRRDFKARLSVEPQLRMLESAERCRDVIHRDVATREEFAFYTNKWLTRRYSRFSFGYFAFHGVKNSILLGKDELSLDDIAEVIDGRATGRTLYFGSCSTLNLPGQDLRRFCKATGARAVVGYSKDVDWLEAAAFDFLLLPELLSSKYVHPAYTRLLNKYDKQVDTLGLHIATAAWSNRDK